MYSGKNETFYKTYKNVCMILSLGPGPRHNFHLENYTVNYYQITKVLKYSTIDSTTNNESYINKSKQSVVILYTVYNYYLH